MPNEAKIDFGKNGYQNGNAHIYNSVDEVPMPWPWKDISPEEVACRRTGKVLIVPGFLDLVQKLKETVKKSGFGALPIADQWCLECNTIGEDNPYAHGLAVRFKVHGRVAWALIGIAGAQGFSGCGVQQGGPREERYIHLDCLSDREGEFRPDIWVIPS